MRVVDHLLAEGFGDSGIRSLASSAGLSDRMLMYYFETKDALIAEALRSISDALELQLDAILPGGGFSGTQILTAITDAGRSESVKPVLRLFFEIVGLAVRGQEPYHAVARSMLERWQGWIERKLRSDQRHRAPTIMAELEGRLMIELLLAD